MQQLLEYLATVGYQIVYNRVVRVFYSCGPLFKIVRACAPEPASNCSKSWWSLKKSLHLESVSDFSIFVPKLWCFLKEKSSLGICLRFFYFRPKIMVFSKRKVFTWNLSPIFLFSSQNYGVF